MTNGIDKINFSPSQTDKNITLPEICRTGIIEYPTTIKKLLLIWSLDTIRKKFLYAYLCILYNKYFKSYFIQLLESQFESNRNKSYYQDYVSA
jgi:hypothetical protein